MAKKPTTATPSNGEQTQEPQAARGYIPTSLGDALHGTPTHTEPPPPVMDELLPSTPLENNAPPDYGPEDITEAMLHAPVTTEQLRHVIDPADFFERRKDAALGASIAYFRNSDGTTHAVNGQMLSTYAEARLYRERLLKLGYNNAPMPEELEMNNPFSHVVWDSELRRAWMIGPFTVGELRMLYAQMPVHQANAMVVGQLQTANLFLR